MTGFINFIAGVLCILLIFMIGRELGVPEMLGYRYMPSASAVASVPPAPTEAPTIASVRATTVPTAVPTAVPTVAPSPTAFVWNFAPGEVPAWWTPGGQALTTNRADWKSMLARCGALIQVSLKSSENTIWINRGSIPLYTEMALDRLSEVVGTCPQEIQR